MYNDSLLYQRYYYVQYSLRGVKHICLIAGKFRESYIILLKVPRLTLRSISRHKNDLVLLTFAETRRIPNRSVTIYSELRKIIFNFYTESAWPNLSAFQFFSVCKIRIGLGKFEGHAPSGFSDKFHQGFLYVMFVTVEERTTSLTIGTLWTRACACVCVYASRYFLPMRII